MAPPMNSSLHWVQSSPVSAAAFWAALSPLIGTVLGAERAAIAYVDDGRVHRLTVGEVIDMEIEDWIPTRWRRGGHLDGYDDVRPYPHHGDVHPLARGRVRHTDGQPWEKRALGPLLLGGMSTTARATTASRPGSGIVVGLLLLAAVAWAGTLAVAQQMGVMAGTMGLAIPAFLLVWLLMMVAMMLPAVAPVAQLYLRTIGRDRRALRVAGFLSGYLLVWTAAGLPAFGMAWGAQQLAAEHSGAARLAAAGTFLAVAVYQVSPLKDVCLKACRSPLGLLLRYGELPRGAS